ncbi:hypothetical protein [Streptomyces sp. NPDC101776]|uniref:hypothetical protein n=1 Tax=Streptomyces sp. NPDC101776 TaxID=3366146 RepID=UPI003806E6F4
MIINYTGERTDPTAEASGVKHQVKPQRQLSTETGQLAVGTGRYDGGYFFEGELLLLHLETGETRSLIEHEIGRQVLGLEWLDEQALQVLMAPPDDWQDKQAWVEGHVAVVHRENWAAVPGRSLTGLDLAGPRVPAPRPDGREAARRVLAEVSAAWRMQATGHADDL